MPRRQPTIQELLKEQRRFVTKPTDGVFTRVGHHEKTKELFLQYSQAIETFETYLNLIAVTESAKVRMKHRNEALYAVYILLRGRQWRAEEDEEDEL